MIAEPIQLSGRYRIQSGRYRPGPDEETDLQDIHIRMRADAETAGGRIEQIYYCPHDWNDGCECRKPKPGMLLAQRELNLDLSRTLFFGDDDRDGEAADNAGCIFVRVSEERPLIKSVVELLKLKQRKGWNTMQKRILITGHKGYIGSVMAPAFVQAGYEVRTGHRLFQPVYFSAGRSQHSGATKRYSRRQ